MDRPPDPVLSPDPDELRVRLHYHPPHDTAGLLRFLAARAIAGLEQAQDGRFIRSLRLPHATGTVRLEGHAHGIDAQFTLQDARDLPAAISACEHLLDLRTDPAPILEHLGADPLIGHLVQASPGRRLPGTVDAHELAMRAVLGQQVTLKAAAKLGAQLVANYGDLVFPRAGPVERIFPTVERIADADLGSLSMPRARRQALRSLARSLAAVPLDARRGDVEATLRSVPGIGPWTAGYIAMRALHDPDAFPVGDVGVQRGAELLGFRGTPKDLERLAERWRPYRAYAIQHLWAAVAGGQCRNSIP